MSEVQTHFHVPTLISMNLTQGEIVVGIMVNKSVTAGVLLITYHVNANPWNTT